MRGSPAYTLARKISAERVYKRRYGGSYRWFYTREHINLPREILAELDPYFTIEARRYFPLPMLPFVFNNLVVGLSLVPRNDRSDAPTPGAGGPAPGRPSATE